MSSSLNGELSRVRVAILYDSITCYRVFNRTVDDIIAVLKDIEEAKSILKDLPFYGIFINSILVSVACIRVRLPQIWILGCFYTRPEFRNKGCATSLASFLVREAFRETNHVGLHVRMDNYPAKRVYESRIQGK